jgi:RNA:NAD 2'-phosphotransferase (TPT1/KptA family)
MRWMSYNLRHNKELITDPSGWVLLTILAKLSPDYPKMDIIDIISKIQNDVKNDSKSRYDIDGDYIRATNGHSVSLRAPIMYKLSDGNSFPWAVHGTTNASWIQIQKYGGLSRMNRDYIHFAVDKKHFRPDSQIEIYLYLDIITMLTVGHELYVTTNGVLLSIEDIPLEFLSIGPKPW